ncbi:hypothetical protein EXS73_00615 [Candidatus Pacearchaeota archaeon]|nr:hypothetical protein [Candidatus Pacearchaeota archaeon]
MEHRPLYVIVHEACVPRASPQARELARIKREERWISAPFDLSVASVEQEERGFVRVCGAYGLACVLAHFEAVQAARGSARATFLHFPGIISATAAFDYQYP